MKKPQIIALMCAGLVLTGCVSTGTEGDRDKDFHRSEISVQEASEVATTEEVENATEEATEVATTEATEEAQASEPVYLEPANIAVVVEGGEVPDENLYFQIDGVVKDDYLNINNITLINGDNTATTEVYNINYLDKNGCTRLVTDDNREYIYLEVGSDNDYYDIYVFDITDGKAEFVGTDGFAYVGNTSITDANNMELWDFTECLCMFTYHNTYMVGPDGMPVAKDNIYTIEGDRSVVSSKALELEILDGEGNATGTMTTVPAESTYTLIDVYKDDTNCAIDAKLDDGTIVRIPVTSITYEAEYNGKPLNEIFYTF